MRPLLVLGCLLVGLMFAGLRWRGAGLPLAGSVQLAAWCGAVMAGVAALGLGTGVHSQVLGYWPLLVMVVAVLASVRAAAVLAGACMGLTLALAANESMRWIGLTVAPRDEGLLLPLVTVALLLASGLVVGALIAFVVNQSLAEARNREERFRELLTMSVDWYWKLDENLRFVHFQDAAGMDPDAPADKRLGLTPWELSDFGLDDDEMDALRADMESRQPFSQLLMRRTDARGRPRIVSCSGRPRFSANGAFRGYWGVGRDITGEMTAQNAVMASETRYRELFERSPTPLVLHRDGRVLDANPASATMCGVADARDMVGFDLLALYRDEESRARELARWQALEEVGVGEGLPVADFVLQSPTGLALSVQATAVRVMADGGPAVLSIYFDVTGRRAAEAALRRSEALLSHLFQTSPGCITLTEVATGRYVMVNPGFTRITGYTAEEVIGRTSQDIGIWHDLADRQRLVDAIGEQGSVNDFQVVFVTRSRALVTLQLSAARFEMAGKAYLVITGNDVTETERARREHAAILQNAPVGIAFVREGRFQTVNPSWERMFGWPPGRLAGEAVAALWPDAPQDDEVQRIAQQRGSREAPLEFERELRRADGTAFWCLLLGQPVGAARAGTGGTLWIAQDVSERRRVDQALATALDQAEAASRAKSAFLANTSHEIRTPLNILLGLARLAQRPSLEPVLRQQYLGQLVESAQSLGEVISDVLDLSKIEAGRLTLESVPFALRELVQSVHRNYLPLAQAKGLLLTLLVADDVPDHVRGDLMRIRQVLVNFLGNAIKFTASGSVQIELGRDASGRIHLAVSDTGPGIDEDTQRRLFHPFVQADASTTRRYGGTGLGLSICRELVQLMGGEIGVRSVPGNGSRFWAALPLPEESMPAPRPRDIEPDATRVRGARVLMVEDNPVNMMISVAQLEQWGARVGQASDGQLAIEAVDLAAQRGEPFDVVLMDLQMP
ncbi:MAG TPA: PAS domain S-box protein, partial [Burkholderiaceae bacterium]|nr:PAS domain S-box protein [Burkholderiaceae bacterium]